MYVCWYIYYFYIHIYSTVQSKGEHPQDFNLISSPKCHQLLILQILYLWRGAQTSNLFDLHMFRNF